ncbi:uncharacterized protein LOC132844138 isoform X2 [Tachysurus vachellii]|uniref:uncharacterized protein LOC132844138 isoform X2 n=1 Tax=Tachysurus vachellii TaxID=175792 RepID=UPI00296B4880|nr:uncharacterized protein LOC132844138 isoform X2 [Tachysurus vachellii]
MQLHDLFSTCLRSPHHHTAALLQWLPVVAHIRFKTLMLAYKALITPHSAPHTLRSTALLHWSHHLSGSHPSSSSSQEANPCGSASSDPVRPDHKIMSSQNSDTYQGLDDMLRQELLQTPGQPLHPQIPTKNSATVVTVPMAKPTPYSGVAEEYSPIRTAFSRALAERLAEQNNRTSSMADPGSLPVLCEQGTFHW